MEYNRNIVTKRAIFALLQSLFECKTRIFYRCTIKIVCTIFKTAILHIPCHGWKCVCVYVGGKCEHKKAANILLLLLLLLLSLSRSSADGGGGNNSIPSSPLNEDVCAFY